jgi:hypothetical protein
MGVILVIDERPEVVEEERAGDEIQEVPVKGGMAAEVLQASDAASDKGRGHTDHAEDGWSGESVCRKEDV